MHVRAEYTIDLGISRSDQQFTTALNTSTQSVIFNANEFAERFVGSNVG
jgi:hypothetical protein